MKLETYVVPMGWVGIMAPTVPKRAEGLLVKGQSGV